MSDDQGGNGLQTWPSMRRDNAELVTRVAGEFDPEVYKDAFAAGSKFSRRDAVALVRERRAFPGGAMTRP